MDVNNDSSISVKTCECGGLCGCIVLVLNNPHIIEGNGDELVCTAHLPVEQVAKLMNSLAEHCRYVMNAAAAHRKETIQ